MTREQRQRTKGKSGCSADILKSAVSKVGVKQVAAQLKVSTSLVYKWCDPKQISGESSINNPLERVVDLYELTQDDQMVQWICEQTNGFLTKNPSVDPDLTRSDLEHTQEIVREFSELLTVISSSISNGSSLSSKQLITIRSEWEDLKQAGESFIHKLSARQEADETETVDWSD